MRNLFIFIKDVIRDGWKIILTLVGVIAAVTAINAFFSSIATSAELEKMELKLAQSTIVQIQQMEKKTESQIMQFKKSMDLDRDLQRLNNINENLMRTKQQLRARPKDKDLKEDYETLKADKEIVQQRIEKR